MKTLIIYFSQTGNTQNVAESIQEGILQATDQCDMVNMAEVDVDSLAAYDLVGLGCPVFYYKEPFNVRAFINALPALEDKKWFIFCSHGSVMGVALISMAEALEKKGICIIGCHHTYADGTIPFYPYPTLTTGHPDTRDLQEAREFGQKIVQCYRQVAAGDPSCISKPDPVSEDWVTTEVPMFSQEILAQVMPKLAVNEELCTQCELCVDACPVAGIDITADPPRIQDPCIFCYYCVKICPACAIEADWSMLVNMAPDNYARYLDALNAAKDRGEFRWLVDPESMNFDDPLYKQRERKVKKEGNQP